MTAITEEIQEVPTILRTSSDGCFEIYNGVWGSYLRPCFDPEANVEITEDHLIKFKLNENIHRIPAELWAKWVKLCFYFVDKVESSVEVSIRILRSEEDPSQYRFLVPLQKVSGASVRANNFDQAVDIETGEEITQYPPTGWIPVGSSHSHNTMSAFFSSIDDKYELDDPGIHLVVGSIDTKNMKYAIAASVVGNHRRFEVNYDTLVDATAIPDMAFNDKVLEYVDYSVAPIPVYGKYNFPKNGTTTQTKTDIYQKWDNLKSWGWSDTNGDYTDPFYWNDEYKGTSSSEDEPKLKLWTVVDTLKDYANQNANDPNRLNLLKDELNDFLIDLDVLMEKSDIVLV